MMVVRLNHRLDRPSEQYSKNGNQSKSIVQNSGHLYIDHNADYGGYRLEEMMEHGTCEFNGGGMSPRLTAGQMNAYLTGIHDALDVVGHKT